MGLLVTATIPKAVGYNYTQAVPSSSWVVNHALNLPNGAVVDVVVDINGTMTKIIPQSITINTANQMTIGFTQLYTGSARFI